MPLAQDTACIRDDQSFASVSSRLQSPRATKMCPQKLMAPFDDKRDHLDAYLHHFEWTTMGQGRDWSEWATALSLCMVGEASSVFERMTACDSYWTMIKLKGLCYRDCNWPQKLIASGSETASLGTLRHENNLCVACRTILVDGLRWHTLQTCTRVCAIVWYVNDLSVACCSLQLRVFLKERKADSLDEVAKHADQYMEAQGIRSS